MSTRLTAAGNGRIKWSAPRWSDLPDDILGAVRSRIISPCDLVRFAAVCKPWRAAASLQPVRPATPLLLLWPWIGKRTEHMCGPDSGWACRVPDQLTNKQFVGSHDGGWVAAIDNNMLVIVNIFSGAQVELSEEQNKVICNGRSLFLQRNVYKIVFSGDPTSSNGCILAAITKTQVLLLCRVGWRHSGWIKPRCQGEFITDIAFCKGELYGRTQLNDELIKFEIGMDKHGTLVVISIHRLAIQNPAWTSYTGYMLELHGKLSMAMQTKWMFNLDPFFKVFNLVDGGVGKACKHRWVEVKSFGDYALFLGPMCSKAVHVPPGFERHGLERNHIYYSKHTHFGANKLPQNVLYSLTSNDDDRICMYYKEDQSVGDGVERTGYYVMGWNDAMWLDPPDM